MLWVSQSMGSRVCLWVVDLQSLVPQMFMPNFSQKLAALPGPVELIYAGIDSNCSHSFTDTVSSPNNQLPFHMNVFYSVK